MGKIPWRRAWPPTPAFLSGESHGQRSLVGYSPWGCKELDVTEATEQTHAGTALVLRSHRENQEGEKNLGQSLKGQCRHPWDWNTSGTEIPSRREPHNLMRLPCRTLTKFPQQLPAKKISSCVWQGKEKWNQLKEVTALCKEYKTA